MKSFAFSFREKCCSMKTHVSNRKDATRSASELILTKWIRRHVGGLWVTVDAIQLEHSLCLISLGQLFLTYFFLTLLRSRRRPVSYFDRLQRESTLSRATTRFAGIWRSRSPKKSFTKRTLCLGAKFFLQIQFFGRNQMHNAAANNKALITLTFELRSRYHLYYFEEINTKGF